MANTFEGKRGESVETEESIAWYLDGDDEIIDKYDNDPAFRVQAGPSIELYGCCGLEESLFGLQLDVDFGSFGAVRGIVQNGMKSVHSSEVFEIAWRCGPNFEGETFTSTHEEGNEIIAWYYLDREDKPSWVGNNVTNRALEFIAALKSAPEGQKVVNWKQPYAAEETAFPGLNDNENERRWTVTLHRLNDPEAAECYGSPADIVYPRLFLFLCYSFSVDNDPSTDLPIIVTKDTAKLYELVDEFMKVLATRDHPRTGYGELIGLEHIVEQFPEQVVKSEKYWKNAYRFSQALMLLLSDDYEQPTRDYHMIDDPERLFDLCAKMLDVFVCTMLPSAAPSDSAREQLKKDLEFNNKHLRQGSLNSIVRDERFQDIGDNMGAYIKYKECLGKKRDWESSSSGEDEEDG